MTPVQKVAVEIEKLSREEREELLRHLQEHDAQKQWGLFLADVMKRLPSVRITHLTIDYAEFAVLRDVDKLEKMFLNAYRDFYNRQIQLYEAESGQRLSEKCEITEEQLNERVSQQVEMYAKYATEFYRACIGDMLHLVAGGLVTISIARSYDRFRDKFLFQPPISAKQMVDNLTKDFYRQWHKMMDIAAHGNPVDWTKFTKDERSRILQEAFESDAESRIDKPHTEIDQENIVSIINLMYLFKKPLTVSTLSRMLKKDGMDWQVLKQQQEKHLQEKRSSANETSTKRA